MSIVIVGAAPISAQPSRGDELGVYQTRLGID
jgi:hypothetical protein